MTKVFNPRKFYQDLDSTRRQRGIAWHKVATRAGMVPSGLAAFARQFEKPEAGVLGKGLSLENVVKLMDWMKKTDLAPYIVDEDHPDVSQ